MANVVDPQYGDPSNRGECLFFAFQALRSELKAKSPSLHRSRDGGPAELIACVLGSLGYFPGPIIFNYPGHDFKDSDPKWLDSRQILLVTTRPPLDPSGRKPIDCSGSPLERKVFESFGTFLACCSRSTIELTNRVEQALGKDKKYLSRADFSVYLEGSSVEVTSEAQQPRRSVGYMISAAAAWPEGPRLLGVFSAAGTDTLSWGYIMATKHRELIKRAVDSDRDTVAIGEFTLPDHNLDRRGSLRFLDEVQSVVTVCEL